MVLKTQNHWNQVGFGPHHGIALPLSALRSKNSCGIGEFYDLIPLIDWCKSLQFDCIQLLPLADTGDDPSPYNQLSSCALDPIYLSLKELPGADPKTFAQFNVLTNLPRVAISTVKQLKLQWLNRYFETVFSSVSQSQSYLHFIDTHSWATPYAVFKSLKTQYNGASWEYWPKEAKEYHQAIKLAQKETVQFHLFLQYLCYTQLKKVREYASAQHFFLKGDIPILLSPDSVDVWANPSLFNLELTAGAPPDYYNKLGQNWGFPLFNWEAMYEADFSWWKQRLLAASHLFHLYRIDHVVGLFRIWGIPKGKKAKEGHFIPENKSLWPIQGQKILEMMLKASPLLPIAEDLGTIPKEVYSILKALGICGTKVIRWERYWEKDKQYIPYALYEPFSMTTVSTHDADTLSGWWKNYPDEARIFAQFKGWTYQDKLTRDQLFSILRDSHQTPSYFHINLLQEYLALFPELVNPNPEEERINVPGVNLRANWTYRFKPFVEEISQHAELTKIMQQFL